MWLERYLRGGKIFLCICLSILDETFYELFHPVFFATLSNCIFLWLEEVLTLCTPNFILFSVLFEIYLN